MPTWRAACLILAGVVLAPRARAQAEPELALPVELVGCESLDRSELLKLLAIEFGTLEIHRQASAERLTIRCQGDRARATLEPEGTSSDVALGSTTPSAWPRLIALSASELVIESRAHVATPSTPASAPVVAVAPKPVVARPSAPSRSRVKWRAGATLRRELRAGVSLFGTRLGLELKLRRYFALAFDVAVEIGSQHGDLADVRWTSEGGALLGLARADVGPWELGVGPGMFVGALQLSPAVTSPGASGHDVRGWWWGPLLAARASSALGSTWLFDVDVSGGVVSKGLDGLASDGRRLVDSGGAWLGASLGVGARFWQYSFALSAFWPSEPLSGMRIVVLAWFGLIALGCSSRGSDAGAMGSAAGATAAGGAAASAGGPASGSHGGSDSAGAGQTGAGSASSTAAGATAGVDAGGANSAGGLGASQAGAGGASANHAGAGGGGASAGGASGAGNSAGSGSGGAPGKWWHPDESTTFYWDLQNAPPDNTKNVGACDIDGWNNTAQEVTALHARGIKVVCYMDAGTYEPGRPDSAAIPKELKGSGVQGWPGELWLDVRPAGPSYAALQAIMLARFKECQKKGFDAVEPDNIDSYQNKPGFPTTAADQLAYNQWIASSVHALGLAVFQKNDLDQVAQLQPAFDGILDEECNKYSECNTLLPYTAAGKPVWDAEYQEDGETTAKFCPSNIKAGIVGALFALDLNGSLFEPCQNDVGIVN